MSSIRFSLFQFSEFRLFGDSKHGFLDKFLCFYSYFCSDYKFLRNSMYFLLFSSRIYYSLKPCRSYEDFSSSSSSRFESCIFSFSYLFRYYLSVVFLESLMDFVYLLSSQEVYAKGQGYWMLFTGLQNWILSPILLGNFISMFLNFFTFFFS